MDQDQITELEVNIMLMLIRHDSHYETDSYSIDYYSINDNNSLEVTLKVTPYNDPFRYKLSIFESERVNKNVWKFNILRDYINFSNKAMRKHSILYNMLSDYTLDANIKVFIILLSKLKKRNLPTVLDYVKNYESNLNEEITKFFSYTKELNFAK